MLDFDGDWLGNEPDWWYEEEEEDETDWWCEGEEVDEFYCDVCDDTGTVYDDHGTVMYCPVCCAGEDY